MWKKWLLLLGIVFVVHPEPSRTSAEHASPVGGGNRSLQVPIGTGIGQPDTVHGNGDIRRRRAADATTDAGSKSGITAEPTERRWSATTYISDTLLSLAQVPLNIALRILAVPLSIVQDVANWGMGVIWNFAGEALVRIWEFSRDFVIPRLDKVSLKIAASESAPPQVKSMCMSLHSGYVFLKLFGYMKPA